MKAQIPLPSVSGLLSGLALGALALTAWAGCPRAEIVLMNQDGLELDGTFQGAFATVNSVNPGFGAGIVNAAGQRHAGAIHGLEAYVEPGLAGQYNAGDFSLYGGISAIGAATMGSGDASFPANATGGHPDAFLQLPEAWARRGSTELKLAGIPDDLLADLLRSAWRKVAPKSLLKDQGPSA